MIILLSLLALTALALGIVAVALDRSNVAHIASLRSGLHRLATAQAEQLLAQSQLEMLRQIQDAAEKTVHLGTSGVRAVHQGIASIPFSILDAIPATRDSARIVRLAHDQISNAVYGGISGANRLIGSALRQGLRDAKPPPKAPNKEPKQPG
jgi:hypothetical protein